MEQPSAEPTVEPELTNTSKATSAPTSVELTGPLSREISGTDCHALAGKYNALTRSDEKAKLPEGLNAAQIVAAENNIEKGADILSGRWENGCLESLVGKEHPESNLKCAMSSKTVAAFDVCLNGPGEQR